MADITIEGLKEKFSTVQKIGQDLKEQSIRLDSEYESLDKQFNEKLAELLEKTGTSSYDDAVSVLNQKKADLDSEMAALNQELTEYLDAYGEQ